MVYVWNLKLDVLGFAFLNNDFNKIIHTLSNSLTVLKNFFKDPNSTYIIKTGKVFIGIFNWSIINPFGLRRNFLSNSIYQDCRSIPDPPKFFQWPCWGTQKSLRQMPLSRKSPCLGHCILIIISIKLQVKVTVPGPRTLSGERRSSATFFLIVSITKPDENRDDFSTQRQDRPKEGTPKIGQRDNNHQTTIPWSLVHL